jgi:PAS domain S-box-containing protein
VTSPTDTLSEMPPQTQRQVLGRAARLLASASDFGGTLQQAIRACLPAVGDFGFFDVKVGDAVRRTSAAHLAADIEEMLAPTQWVRQERTDMNLCALSSGAPALHADTDDEWYRRVAVAPGHLQLLRALAFRSMITVPMRYRDELLGALTLFMGRSGRRHTQDDLEFAAELAMLAAPVVASARLVEQHRQAEERLRMAVEAGQVGIWEWDIAGGAVRWSDRVYEMHGLPLGCDTGGLKGFRERVHPQDWPRVEQALATALETGDPYAVEFRAVLPSGSERWIATRSHVVRDAAGKPLRMVGASIDTTERMALLAAERAARSQAEAARRRLETLARAGELLAHSLDTEDTLRAIATTVVPGVADWCRIDLLDEQGVPQRRLAFHSDAERAERALRMARGLRASAEVGGSMAWCMAQRKSWWGRFDEPPACDAPDVRLYASTFGMREHFIVPLVARGRTLGAMAVVQAESGRTLTEDDRALVQELGQRAALALDNARLYAQAETARRQAEDASRAKDEFLAMLGHELRNPLAPIATALELMARREPQAHGTERRIIARQMAHLSRLIDDLLDVSRIAQGKIELQRHPVDLNGVIANAIEQTQPVFEKRVHPVRLQLPGAPALVLGDAVRLTQVVCNLLINAAKFTPPEREVSLTLRADGDAFELVVQDQGRGIAPELLPRVFDLFVQGSQPLDRRAGGLGLGLSIVRTLAQLHGGSVRADSPGQGQGSRFTVRLPSLSDSSSSPSRNDMPDFSDNAATGGLRILIVDDNTDASETLAELLRIDGYDVRCAPDGEAALAVLKEYDAQVALLDIGLPGMDGYQLAEAIRATPQGAAMRLVALTGYGRDNDRARAMQARFDEHLVKPVAPDRLLEVLQSFAA